MLRTLFLAAAEHGWQVLARFFVRQLRAKCFKPGVSGDALPDLRLSGSPESALSCWLIPDAGCRLLAKSGQVAVFLPNDIIEATGPVADSQDRLSDGRSKAAQTAIQRADRAPRYLIRGTIRWSSS
jgi:hypothetical protein